MVRLASAINEGGRAGVEAEWERTPDFHLLWKNKSRDMLARAEWRRRKLTKRVCPANCSGLWLADIYRAALLHLHFAADLVAILESMHHIQGCFFLSFSCTGEQLKEEEERIEEGEADTRKKLKAMRDHNKEWEGTRENRVSRLSPIKTLNSPGLTVIT